MSSSQIEWNGAQVSAANPLPTSTALSSAAGGYSTAKVLSAATTNATVVKASPGRVYVLQFVNNATTTRYIKFHDIATAPTVGTTAVYETIGIPAGGSRSINLTSGIYFASGIAYSITTNAADNDATAVAANDIVGAIHYL